MKQLLLFIIITIFLCSCGSGGGSDNTNNQNTSSQEQIKFAYFVDSPIEGIFYTCGNINGLTQESGKFYYKDSCNIKFKLGNLLIGNINPKSINKDSYVLPPDLLGVDRKDSRHKKVIEIIQLLQSLDDDNNPDNNITITKDIRNAFKKEILDFKENSIHNSKITSIILSLGKKIPSRKDALEHYERMLEKNFNLKINKKYNFNYSNQKQVKINIFANELLANKQILLYENQEIIPLSVGNYEKLNNKIISTVFNNEGKLEISYTFANHIKNIWIVIPYYAIKQKLPLKKIMEIRINKEGEIL